MALMIEVNEHPEQYVEGMKQLCVSASLQLPAGVSVHAPAAQSELMKIQELARAAGFSVSIEQGRRNQSLYVDVCAPATSPAEFKQQQGKATQFLYAVAKFIEGFAPQSLN